jgi:predicted RNase H-like HicB family nuclease/uncharacterized damage-inducible protein DinB
MTHYRVFLEMSAEALEEGGYLAHVPELIGCIARGKTKEQAIENIRDSIAAYLTLLRNRGISVPAPTETVELDITQTESLTFEPDYEPLSDQELDDLWHIQTASRELLLETLSEMPSSDLNWRHEPQSWSVRNVLEHMARADLWYASRLEENALAELTWRLGATRELVMNQLHNLPGNARGRVTRHEGEDWTPRKVARRMLEHEQEHLQQIREILRQAQ